MQDEIRAAGGDATFVTCDVSDHASVEAAVAHTVEAYGGVQILVNNAGGGALGGRAGGNRCGWKTTRPGIVLSVPT